MRHDGTGNLIPFDKRTEQEQREIARQGGIRSGEVRKEKKRMSQIYADFLMKEHDIKDIDGNVTRMTGAKIVNTVMKEVLTRNDSASVSLIREMREGTEGAKVKVNIDNLEDVIGEIEDLFDEEIGRDIEEEGESEPDTTDSE